MHDLHFIKLRYLADVGLKSTLIGSNEDRAQPQKEIYVTLHCLYVPISSKIFNVVESGLT